MNLQEILEEHSAWLESGGAEGTRANLRDATLEGATLEGANLEGANLRGANLWGANLRDATLEGANLWGANLRDATLEGANLWGANLGGANLEGANLRGANLEGANLWGCSGNRVRIKSLFVSEKYPITYTSGRLQIGCKNYSFEEWRNFTDEEIEQMDLGALEFWKEFKDYIFMSIERFPAK